MQQKNEKTTQEESASLRSEPIWSPLPLDSLPYNIAFALKHNVQRVQALPVIRQPPIRVNLELPSLKLPPL